MSAASRDGSAAFCLCCCAVCIPAGVTTRSITTVQRSLPRALEEAAQAGGAGSVGHLGSPLLGAQREPSGGPAGVGAGLRSQGRKPGRKGPEWRWRLPAQGRQWGEAGGPPAVLEACLDSSYWSPGTQGWAGARARRQNAGEAPTPQEGRDPKSCLSQPRSPGRPYLPPPPPCRPLPPCYAQRSVSLNPQLKVPPALSPR